ncbi:MAG: hypothetical protein QME32_03235 [Endomicrobiia bacterium]|nr:hypothetical protein [Endomicrobiia bacterium]
MKNSQAAPVNVVKMCIATPQKISSALSAAGVLLFLATAWLAVVPPPTVFAAEPPPLAETFSDSSVIEEIGYFAAKGGTDFRKRYARMKNTASSRMAWARFFNEVAWRVDIFDPVDEERFERVVKYFETEYALINLENAVKETPRLDIAAEFSVNADYAWGQDVETSVAAFYQQIRLAMNIRRKEIFGRLALRNFGFWGVNEYSSGSVGINFKTSDPLWVDELYVKAGERAGVEAGRRYFKYGIWGLAVNHIYAPADSVEMFWNSKVFSARAASAVQYETMDYYAAELRLKGDDATHAGVSGFLSAASDRAIAAAGGDNDMAVSVFGALGAARGFSLSAESAVYKQNSSSSEEIPVVVEAAYRLTSVDAMIRWAEIPDIRFPGYTIARAPLDYLGHEYLAGRFITKMRGFNTIVTMKYADPVFSELEHTQLSGTHEDVVFSKTSARIIYRPRSGSALVGALDFSSSALESVERDYREWRVMSQAVFGF